MRCFWDVVTLMFLKINVQVEVHNEITCTWSMYSKGILEFVDRKFGEHYIHLEIMTNFRSKCVSPGFFEGLGINKRIT